MKPRLFATLVALGSMLAVVPPALSQPAPPPADPKVEAKARYDRGLNHYNLGEFDQAIAEFKAAYSMTSAPGLLFNIAQSYRLKKDYEQASLFYKNYLRLKPDAANKADVEERIKEMDKNIEDQKAIGQALPRGTIPPDDPNAKPVIDPKTVVAPPPEVKQPEVAIKVDHGEDDRAAGHTLQTAGLATAGAGVALVVTGVVFGSMASSAAKDLSALSTNMGTWSKEAQDKYDSGQRANTIAIISYVAGGAAIATGGVLWYLGRVKVQSATIAVVPTPTGTSFTARWSF